jgi:hypothetical protein
VKRRGGRDLLLVLKDLKPRSLGHEAGLGMTTFFAILSGAIAIAEHPK